MTVWLLRNGPYAARRTTVWLDFSRANCRGGGGDVDVSRSSSLISEGGTAATAAAADNSPPKAFVPAARVEGTIAAAAVAVAVSTDRRKNPAAGSSNLSSTAHAWWPHPEK